jgi:hypothetical protein
MGAARVVGVTVENGVVEVEDQSPGVAAQLPEHPAGEELALEDCHFEVGCLVELAAARKGTARERQDGEAPTGRVERWLECS